MGNMTNGEMVKLVRKSVVDHQNFGPIVTAGEEEEDEIVEGPGVIVDEDLNGPLGDVGDSDSSPKEPAISQNEFIRNILVIGLGDAGLNITSLVAKRAISSVRVVMYNTAMSTMEDVEADDRVYAGVLDGKDMKGSGKNRTYSKLALKAGKYKKLQKSIEDINNSIRGGYDYAIIVAAADGGTGSGASISLAKIFRDTIGIDIIMMGIYPVSTSDAVGHYNTLEWTNELIKEGFPYVILDNDAPLSLGITNVEKAQQMVNEKAADIVEVLSGTRYGMTHTKQIDTANLYRMIHDMGERIVAVTSQDKPTSGQSLDDYIQKMLDNSYQPLPFDTRAMGIWVKGPEEFLDSIDHSVPTLKEKYGGRELHFDHIEKSTNISISAIFTGCTEPVARLKQMSAKYEEAKASVANRAHVIGEIFSNLKPIEGPNYQAGPKKTTVSNTEELDDSYFD